MSTAARPPAGTPDFIAAELVRNGIETLGEEMLHLLHRSAYSTLMRESRDCSFLLVTPGGDMVCEGPRYYRHAVQRLIAEHPFADGDIFLTNHPYESGVQHTPDLLVIVPVFEGGVHIGFSCSTAHKPDVGGSVVGSVSGVSTDLFQEGLLLPIMNAGHDTPGGFEIDDRILRIIAANVRNPDLFLGDMRAQIGVSRVGRDRLRELARKLGSDVLLRAYDEILDQGERMIRRRLSAWPDGTVRVEGFIDDDGIDHSRPVRYEMVVTKTGDQITFDCTGSDDQTVGPVNMTLPYMEGFLYNCLLAMTEPAAAFNDGMRRAVTVLVRDGSVFSPRFPAPVGASTVVHHRVVDLALEALGHFAPQRAVAHGGGSGGTLAILWSDATGERTTRSMQYEILGTALGASAARDGCDGTSASGQNMQITSIEVLESQFPVRIKRFELIQDSGGPGRFRGGLSYRREYECLAPATLNRRADRGKFPGNGIQLGRPGACGRLVIDAGTERERVVPPAGMYQLDAGQTFLVEGSGGGGCGDPLQRDPAAVARDVTAGYVSRRSAYQDYGVAIDEDGVVDPARTAVVRADRGAA